MRFLLGAFGDPGHAFPMIALGSALVARGHTVSLDTWVKWREPVEAAGMTFTRAPEYQVFPTPDKPLKPYAAAVRAWVQSVANASTDWRRVAMSLGVATECSTLAADWLMLAKP